MWLELLLETKAEKEADCSTVIFPSLKHTAKGYSYGDRASHSEA